MIQSLIVCVGGWEWARLLPNNGFEVESNRLRLIDPGLHFFNAPSASQLDPSGAFGSRFEGDDDVWWWSKPNGNHSLFYLFYRFCLCVSRSTSPNYRHKISIMISSTKMASSIYMAIKTEAPRKKPNHHLTNKPRNQHDDDQQFFFFVHKGVVPSLLSLLSLSLLLWLI